MTPDELDGWLERARTECASTIAPDGFTDRVMRQVRHHEPPLPGRLDVLSGAIASGALVGSGAFVWLSLGTPDPASGPLALAAAMLVMIGLAWTWFDDPRGLDLRFRLSDFRPY